MAENVILRAITYFFQNVTDQVDLKYGEYLNNTIKEFDLLRGRVREKTLYLLDVFFFNFHGTAMKRSLG